MKLLQCGVLALSMATSSAVAAERKHIHEEGTLSPIATAEDLPELELGDELHYEMKVYRGARQLNMSLKFVDYARKGLDLLYKREYRKTRDYFAELEEVYPGTAVASIADLLVWQCVMLENFDFRHDAQYRAASEGASRKLEAALKEPGNESWENFMMAGVVGIEAIHAARQGRYLPALTLAFNAIDHVEQVRAHSPDFVDLKLADGLYNYWRTVLTQKNKALPDFGDNKKEGIEQMQTVEKQGIFLGPPATLSMAFTWIEENEYKLAVNACARNHVDYPKNLVNELMLGVSLLYLRQYDESIKTFDNVLAIDSKNKRVRYYKGLALHRSGNVDAAGREFEAYLAADYLEKYQRAAAHYRLGRVKLAQKRYDEAESHFKEAVKIDGHSSSKAELDRIKKGRKDGSIK